MKENHTIDDRRRYLIQQCRYYKGEEENPYAKEENNPLVQTIPSSLAGLLLSRYMYWSDPYHPSEGFEEWLKEHYLKFASKTEER